MNKNIMQAAGFKEEVELIKRDLCPLCKQTTDRKQFRNEISIKEFHISGLCQHCQDETFGKD